MHCRSAHRLISAERDRAISARERTALEAHLAGCAPCRLARENLAAAASAWKVADRATTAPDAEQAWRAIRHEIRAENAGGKSRGQSWSVRALWAGVPIAAAAAIALVVGFPGPDSTPPGAAPSIESWTQFVAVEHAASAPVIFFDQESGWTVVWASDPEGEGAQT
jgi:hypothetical protein